MTTLEGPFSDVPIPENPLKAGMRGRFRMNGVSYRVRGQVINTKFGMMIDGGAYGHFSVTLFDSAEIDEDGDS